MRAGCRLCLVRSARLPMDAAPRACPVGGGRCAGGCAVVVGRSGQGPVLRDNGAARSALTAAGDRALLDAGDRPLHDAFRAVLSGDSEPLAKIAPTSLVFGVWDSRDTQAKLPRLVSSTIRAFGVRKMTRGAVYIPPVDYSDLDVFSETEKAKTEGSSKSPLAQRGFVHNLASASHGGVIATGGIRRDATLSLAALHLLKAGDDEGTLALRRYVFGLALVALTANTSIYH